MDIENALTNHLKNFDSVPFLFVGSGFSRRYIDLEDWEGLLRKFCNDLPKSFEYYLSSANNNLPKAAELMSEDFFEIWWENDQFEESRNNYKNQVTNKSDPLKIEISKYLKQKQFEFGKNEQVDLEINQLKNVVVDGIITTNWDIILENLFKDQISVSYVGQEELLFSETKEIAEIYKIHGCCTKPSSLILTHQDYEDFKEKNAYLAAKLLTVFIEHPIVFIGYSMSDENIVDILKSITTCLSEEHLHKLTNRLIFLQRDTKNEGDSFQSTTMVIKDTPVNITLIKTNQFEKVYKAMSITKRKIPAKLYRQMKSQIYELVKTNDPNEQIYAAVDIEKDVDPSEIEFVYGVGISNQLGAIGYAGLSSDELFEGVIKNIKKWDYNQIILNSLPAALKVDLYIPVFKYYSLSDDIQKSELNPLVQRNLEITLDDLLDKKQKANMEIVRRKYSSIIELEEKFGEDLNVLFDYIPLLKNDDIDQFYLRKLIMKHIHLLKVHDNTRSKYRKLIRFYDLLVFKE